MITVQFTGKDGFKKITVSKLDEAQTIQNARMAMAMGGFKSVIVTVDGVVIFEKSK